MGIKNAKGSVSIEDFRGRIRLRWRYLSKRYSLSLSCYNQTNLLQARKTGLQIEQDMVTENFDSSLVKYKGKLAAKINSSSSIVQLFEEWTTNYKQMDCEKHTNYDSVRNMLRKWGKIETGNIQKKFSQQTNAAVTYNRRLTMLMDFIRWLVKKGVWTFNPLEDIKPKRIKKVKQEKRKPFTEQEISSILDAFKNDTFTPKCSAFKHSHYYPFIYFIFKTGVRNAEAIGLRIQSIDTKQRYIHIKEVLARGLKSTSAASRIRKETKNGKERILPLTDDLYSVLLPLLDRKDDDLVFQSPNGLAIDDNNFQSRIFKKVLQGLKINDRVLYACRHTFGSRCIDSGITPVMTAFLMGNNPETALRNYTHQLTIPTDLPKI
ncbi:MAG TPA: tyrosine-type recombinase/integrase [Ferruginibacter sp.]|nr:tyrosine-type recombinase/integrase [Ferruginibacter sp.]